MAAPRAVGGRLPAGGVADGGVGAHAAAELVTWQYGPVGRTVGLLELALGRRDEAKRRLREAVALRERIDARAFLAIARHDVGELLLPSAEGLRLLDQARDAADELGMPGLTKRARAVCTWRSTRSFAT